MINDDDFSLEFYESDREGFLGDCSTPVDATASPASLYDPYHNFPTPELFDSSMHGILSVPEITLLSSATDASESRACQTNAPGSPAEEGGVSAEAPSLITQTQVIGGWTILTFDNSHARVGKRDVRNVVPEPSSKRTRTTTNLRKAAVINNEPLISRLKKFGIHPETYVRYCAYLNELGYDEKSINRLVIGRSRHKTIEGVLSMHRIFMDRFSKYGLGHQDLVHVCARDGGHKNLKALIINYKKLKKRGYSPRDIINLASNKGGTAIIKAVLKYHGKLSRRNFKIKQIVRMAAMDGGSRNLKSVIKYHDALKTLNLSIEEIIRVVSHHGGSSNIKTVVKTLKVLNDHKFTNSEIVKLVSRDGGSGCLQALADNEVALRALGFTRAEIIRMAMTKISSDKLALVVEFCKKVPGHTFTTTQIVGLICKGWPYFEAYRMEMETLIYSSSGPKPAAVYSPTFFTRPASHSLLPDALVYPMSQPLFTDTELPSSLFDGSGSFFSPGQSVVELSESVEPEYPGVNLF
ncbi:hypothetical protein [Legionella sp. CNM-4043-24]|uniref:hypothetical protein n=1 Tax=Legionella sp. CNM-4043-24 TaxID=3421646 RepID=UPI00403ABEFE